jgi:DnaJ-class molecular chaperone
MRLITIDCPHCPPEGRCPECRGSGRITVPDSARPRSRPCRHCAGKGCPQCRGLGKVCTSDAQAFARLAGASTPQELLVRLRAEVEAARGQEDDGFASGLCVAADALSLLLTAPRPRTLPLVGVRR